MNVYNRGKLQLLTQAAAGLDFRVLLLRNDVAYSYDPDHNFVADVLTGGVLELSVAGYARQVLANVAAAEDDTGDLSSLAADAVAFGSLATGQTIDKAIVFVQVTNDADSYLIGHYDLADTPTFGGDVTLRFNATDPGIFVRLLDS